MTKRSKKSDEGKASNFELNFITLQGKTFQLEKGDLFWTNGAIFVYEPIGKENQNKLPWSHYRRDRTISCVKYKKDVIKADNLKKIVDEQPVEGSRIRMEKWVVEYAYKMEAPEKDQLQIFTIERDGYRKEGELPFSHKVHTVTIERETKEQFFVKPDNPMNYHSRIERKELMEIQTCSRGMFIVAKLEDYHEAEQKLFKAYEELLESNIVSSRKHLAESEDKLVKFQTLKSKHGF